MAYFCLSGKKINVSLFEDEFNKHATEGYIGDPAGPDAYGYIRVSTPAQAKEDRSGLLRQIENIHIAAKRKGIRISWEMVYGDDESGYFLERPALKELLKETLKSPRGKHVVFEDIKRMSREWRWHQGYLFEQFEVVREMEVIFFTEANSEIERVFQGYAADAAAKYNNQIMKDGIRKKALRGAITNSSNPLFGYIRTDPDGLVSPRTQRETRYFPRQPEPNAENGCRRYGEAKIMQEIYEALAYEGISTRKLAMRLNEKYGPPRKSKSWDSSYICKLVANTAFYGDYIGHRYGVKIVHEPQPDGSIKKKKVNFQYPEETWWHITIDNPIVSKDLWLLANEVVAKNKITSPRNERNDNYLLTGFLRCPECGYAWNAIPVRSRKGAAPIIYYRCTTAMHAKIRATYGIHCSMRTSVQAAVLEKAVWEVVKQIVYEPEVVFRHIDDQFMSDSNRETQNQIDYLLRKIQDAKDNDQRDRELYNAGYMKLHEYGPKHLDTQNKIELWEEDIRDLERKKVTEQDVADRKAQMLRISAQAKQYEKLDGDVPLEMKRALLKMAVTKIYVDSNTGMMKIEGIIGPQIRSFLPLTGQGINVDISDTNSVNRGPSSVNSGPLFTFVLLASFAEGTIQAFRLLSRIG